MKRIFFTFILTIGLSVEFYGQNSARELLENDLIKTKKIMRQDVRVYNYFYLPDDLNFFATEEIRKKWITESYISARAGNFWNSEFTDSNPSNYANGAGLYFAIDPLISKKYGNTFIEIIIPKDTPYLNVVSPIPLSSLTRNALVKEGYITAVDQIRLFPKNNGFYRDTLRVMVEPQLIKFRELVQDIFDSNQIQYIEYNFNTELAQICSTHSYSAFTLIGSKSSTDFKNAILPKNIEGISFYSTELNLENLSEYEILEKDRILKLRNMLDELKNSKLKFSDRQNVAKKNYPGQELTLLKKSLYSCEDVKK